MSKYKKTLSIGYLSNLNVTLNRHNVSDLPTVKHFFEDSKDLQPTYEEDNEATHNLLENLKITDAAFVNSILAYASYQDNIWTLLDFDKNIEDISDKIQSSFDSPKNLYNFKIWNYLNNHFKKIPDYEFMRSKGFFKSEYGFDVNYTFDNGQYSSVNGLAHASILTRKNPNGDGNILHVSFRGTEFSKLSDYVKKAYLNMTAYYENFLPLEKAILDYANNPENNISAIEVTGHSLGGAMVQEFLRRNNTEKTNINISGYTFGSPGATKKNYMSFLNIGYQIMKKRNIVNSDFVINAKEPDKRLHEFYHTNDPIPRLGLLGYTKNGISYDLLDNVYQTSKEAKQERISFLEKMPSFGRLVTYMKEKFLNRLKIRFHDSNRYVNNIKNIIDKNYNTYPQLISHMHKVTNGWQDFLDSDHKFRQLSIKYKDTFEEIIKQKNPSLTSEEVQKELLCYRELMKYENQTNLIIAQSGENQFYTQNFSGKQTNTAKAKLNMKELREKYLNKKRIITFAVNITLNKS